MTIPTIIKTVVCCDGRTLVYRMPQTSTDQEIPSAPQYQSVSHRDATTHCYSNDFISLTFQLQENQRLLFDMLLGMDHQLLILPWLLTSWDMGMLKVSTSYLLILFLISFLVSNSVFNPSDPATISNGDSALSAEPLYHFLDPQPALETDRNPTPEKKKQKESPTTTSAETTVVTKRIKTEGSGSHGQIWTADFNELTWSIIEETISIYHAQIGSVEPFPEHADDRNTVKQAWLEVCGARNIELEEDIFKLVSYSSYYIHS